MIEVYNNVWCKACQKEVQCHEKMYHCNMCPDLDICENCQNRGRNKHCDPSHTFRKVKFAGAPSEAALVAEHKECNKCDEDLDEEDWFYSSLRDRNYDLCIQCYNKQIRKGKISQGQFKIAVYALPPDGVMVLENRNCTQCHLRIKRDDCFYIYKTSRSSQLCQSCFIKSGLPEDSFILGAYEPGHPELDNDGVAGVQSNYGGPPPAGGQQQAGAWVMPSGPPVYSQVAGQGRTEGQGWSMPSAPPNYSDLSNGGSGMIPPPMSLNPNDNPDLPPPSYEDAMKNTDASGNSTSK